MFGKGGSTQEGSWLNGSRMHLHSKQGDNALITAKQFDLH